eukprot:1029118-Amphidinium_carterae.1
MLGPLNGLWLPRSGTELSKRAEDEDRFATYGYLRTVLLGFRLKEDGFVRISTSPGVKLTTKSSLTPLVPCLQL